MAKKKKDEASQDGEAASPEVAAPVAEPLAWWKCSLHGCPDRMVEAAGYVAAVARYKKSMGVTKTEYVISASVVDGYEPTPADKELDELLDK